MSPTPTTPPTANSTQSKPTLTDSQHSTTLIDQYQTTPAAQIPYQLQNISNFITITLKDNNYVLWRKQLQTILLTCRLLHHIDDTSEATSSHASQWELNDGLISCALIATRSPEIASLSLFQGYSSGIWDYIGKLLFSTSHGQKTTSPTNSSRHQSKRDDHYLLSTKHCLCRR